MRLRSRLFLLLLFCGFYAAAAVAAVVPAGQGATNHTVRFATAEWPPYLGSRLPEGGAINVVLSKALATQGYKAELVFFPWARTIQSAHDKSLDFDGYVVDYYSADVAHDYLLSSPVAYSPLILASHNDAPLQWHGIADLTRYRLGLVRGYINTRGIDERVASGEIRAELVMDDAANVRLLMARRVDAIAIDSHVLAWLITHNPAPGLASPRIHAEARVLEEKALYACFRRTARGAVLQRALDTGLTRIDSRRVLAEYFQRISVPAR